MANNNSEFTPFSHQWMQSATVCEMLQVKLPTRIDQKIVIEYVEDHMAMQPIQMLPRIPHENALQQAIDKLRQNDEKRRADMRVTFYQGGAKFSWDMLQMALNTYRVSKLQDGFQWLEEHGEREIIDLAIKEYFCSSWNSVPLGSLLRLTKEEWLDDEVLNFKIAALQTKAPPTTLILHSYFYEILRNHCTGKNAEQPFRLPFFASNGKQIRPADGINIVLMPINIGNCHWTLAMIDIQKNQLLYGDSLGSQYIPETLRDHLTYWAVQNNLCTDLSKEVEHLPSYPRQPPTSGSCGVIVIRYMEMVVGVRKDIWSPEDSARHRIDIMKDIMKQGSEEVRRNIDAAIAEIVEPFENSTGMESFSLSELAIHVTTNFQYRP
jgi:hypothetical protein